jgi:hypothetical protein
MLDMVEKVTIPRMGSGGRGRLALFMFVDISYDAVKS